MNNETPHQGQRRYSYPLKWMLTIITSMLLFCACGRPDTGGYVEAPHTASPSIVPVSTGLATTKVHARSTAIADSAAPSKSKAGTIAINTPRGSRLRGVQLVTTTSGWALTDTGIQWTTNMGRQWVPLPLPPSMLPSAISTVLFLDASQGWLIGVPSEGQTAFNLVLFHTHDGGHSWTSPTVLPLRAGEMFGGSAYIDFIDATHGWVMARLQTSSAFSAGRLFQTQDSGVSWTNVSAPSGDPIRFISERDGWTTNSVQARLYITHDGGQNWQPQVVSAAIADPSVTRDYTLPTFTNKQDGILPITTTVNDHSTLSFYRTRDGGQSWSLAATLATPTPGDGGITDVIGTDRWVVVLPNGIVRRTQDAGTHWEELPTPSLPEGIIDLSFAGDTNGWAQRMSGHCAKFKSECSTQTELLVTTNGGQTWTVALSFTAVN